MIPNKKVRFEVVKELSKKYNPRLLCLLSSVSMSGYYQFLKRREDKEEKDICLIRELSIQSKRKYGYRTVTMVLAQRGIYMNHKKVLRLMHKYDLLAKVRRRNPYKRIMKRTQEHRIAQNILGRAFRGVTPFSKI